jgi:hypothetical protein
MFSKQFVALVFFVLQTLAAPSPFPSYRETRDSVPGRYIVTLKDSTDNLSGAPAIYSQLSPDSTVTHEWDIISGFAGSFTDDDVEFLKSHPDIETIEEDGYAHTQTVTTQ